MCLDRFNRFSLNFFRFFSNSGSNDEGFPSKDSSEFLDGLEKKIKAADDKFVQQNRKKKDRKRKEIKFPKDSFSLAPYFIGVGIAFFVWLYWAEKDVEAVAYTQFIQGVHSGNVRSCTILGKERIRFELNGVLSETVIPYDDQNLVSLLLSKNVSVSSEKETFFKQFLLPVLPFALMLAIFYTIFFRAFRGKGSGGALGFGRIRAKLFASENVQEGFEDVQGCDEAKVDLQEIVQFLKDPQRYQDMGAKIPRGVLLEGPPGTGKTLLARAVAGEAGVPFFSVSGSDFVDMFVGVGASRARDLFEMGRKNSPCIIFIDEIDAVGRSRGTGHGGGHDEREQTLNQILVEMDGFEQNDSLIVMAATNRSDVLDRALLRPGRFNRRIVVDVPDVRGRKGIIKIHTNRVKLHPDVDLDHLSSATPGFTGADLSEMVNEAAILATRRDKKMVDIEDFEEARDKIMMGAERRSMFLKQEEKELTAYHEAGHALVSVLLNRSDKLHKLTIIPRGRALGLTWFLPEDGKYSAVKSKLEQDIMVGLGGRIAEEIIFGEVSTGAAKDIQTATGIARDMVTKYGMSELGPLYIVNERNQSNPFGSPSLNFSEDTARKVDSEVSKIVFLAYQKTTELLKSNIDKLKALAKTLLDKEILSAKEVLELFRAKDASA